MREPNGIDFWRGVRSFVIEGRPLNRMTAVIQERRALKVLVLGPSSVNGPKLGSSLDATFHDELDRVLPDMTIPAKAAASRARSACDSKQIRVSLNLHSLRILG